MIEDLGTTLLQYGFAGILALYLARKNRILEQELKDEREKKRVIELKYHILSERVRHHKP